MWQALQHSPETGKGGIKTQSEMPASPNMNIDKYINVMPTLTKS